MLHNQLPMSSEDCKNLLSVSRETIEKFTLYISLLNKWQKKINLVGKSTLQDPWNRHIYDCGQAFKYVFKYEKKGKILDVGSGAGLPGVVWSIMGLKDIVLVESDVKKSIFLHEVARLCEINVEIINSRIEVLKPIETKIITARAFAPLYKMFDYLENKINSFTRLVLFKGINFQDELKFAEKYWIKNYQNKLNLSPEFNIFKSNSNYNSKIIICCFNKV